MSSHRIAAEPRTEYDGSSSAVELLLSKRQAKRMWYAKAGPSMTTLSASFTHEANGLSAAVRPRIPIPQKSNKQAGREQRLRMEWPDGFPGSSPCEQDERFNREMSLLGSRDVSEVTVVLKGT